MKSEKLILLGESKVGKTMIISQLINHSFSIDYMNSISCKYKKEFEINKKIINLEIWDLPGLDGYSANRKLMKNSKIALLIFDITNLHLLENLHYWYKEICENNIKENIFFVVIGNKIDLNNERKINYEEGEKFAKSIQALFYEITAKDYDNVEKMFNNIMINYLSSNNKIINKEGDLKIKTHLSDSRINVLKIKKDDNNSSDIGEKKKIKYDNGDFYKGYIKYGLRQGKGIMKYKNGDEYNGNWFNDLKEGEGTMKYKNGEQYIGNWIYDKRERKGIMKYINGDKYDGEWENDLIINGVMKYCNGSEYDGEWNNGLRDGKGIMKYYDGNEYDGLWIKNLKNGYGIMKYNNKDIYEGNWKNDIKEGKGIFYWLMVKYIKENLKMIE